ncbi:MAG: DMT family transporter [Paludibacteraceae bacterium]|nr:DMT family transporter [Paludibacteraceae bacterium]
MQKEHVIGHISAAGAYLIFGINILTSRQVALDGHITPISVFAFRSVGAALLFWAISLIRPRQQVEFRDLPRIFLASLLGLFLTQMTFLQGITIITPFDCAIVASLTPVMTMFVAAVAIKEPITWRKLLGVLVSLLGVLVLIFNTRHVGGAAQTQPLGVLLILLNGLCFACYLGVFKPLIDKYNVIDFMKWMFLFSALMSLPFAADDLLELPYAEVSPTAWGCLSFTVVAATCISYFLIPVAQRRIRPTLVSMYSYLQPIIAAVLGILAGMDELTVIKVVSAGLVFLGVAIVNRSRSRISPPDTTDIRR